jgi:lambda family phage tail tape measure protein
MSQVTKLIVRIQEQGGEQLKKLESNLQNVGKQATATNINFKQLNTELKTVYAQSTQSINSLKAFSAAFREVANNTDVTSQEFFEAKTQADLLDQRLLKLTQTNKTVADSFDRVGTSAKQAASQVRTSTGLIRDPLTGAYRGTPGVTQYDSPIGPQPRAAGRGLGAFLAKRGLGGVGGAARIAGGVASGAVFGGAAGAGGALLGALGGPAGIVAGATIGAVAGQLQEITGATATYAAELQKQRIALAGLTTDYGEYQKALGIVEKLSNQFAIPQELITRQFTKLSASVIGAGGTLKDAEEAFVGVAAGIRGTGGGLNDLDAALTATAQVFSKGKVSAEELRQQIGERLPGAFTLFAESLNMTPAELDKALEDGKVSLQDFQAFSAKLFERFGKSAEAIVNSPAAAGDRLQVQLSKLSENIGKLLAPIGAAFQDVFTNIIKLINGAVSALNRLFKIDLSGEVENLTAQIQKQEAAVESARNSRERQQRLRTLQNLRADLKQATQQRSLYQFRTDTDSPSGLPGADTSAGAENKRKKIKDITDAELLLYIQIDKALENRNKLQAIFLKGTLDTLKAENDLRAGDIGKNEAERQRLQARRGVLDAIQQERDAINEISKKVEEQRINDKQALLDLQIQYGLVNQKKAEELQFDSQIAKLRETFKDSLLKDELEKLIEQLKAAREVSKSFGGELSQSFASIIKASGDLAQNLGSTLGNAFLGLGDQLSDFVTTGKLAFNDFARSVLSDLSKIFIRFAMFEALKAVVPSGSSFGKFLGFANGGIMTANGPLDLKRYATGGIANSPQLAMFGEGSTPEAYVPLPDGRSIPVTMKGAGNGTNVVVNVDAKGTGVQGDQPNGAALGRAIGAAVQAELIKQRRPGGLLA